GFTALTDEKAVLKSTRDREAREAAKAAKADAAASTPPSNAAKPKTDAIETSPAIKSPSTVKVSPNGEKAASVKAPRHSAAAADRAAPEVEGTSEPRSHARPRRTVRDEKAPELLRGEALGPDGKRAKGDAPAPAGVMSSGTDRAAKPAKAEKPQP